MAQTGFTPISIYYSATATNVPTAGNLVAGELAINTADGKLFYKDSSGVVQTIASKAGALGDVVGPASATDNALARFDLTTGKLIQNSVGILSDAGALSGLTALSTGTLSATGVATFSAGTVSLPAITTTGDTNTGIFFPAADTIAFTEGGAESMRITSAGDVGIGTSSPLGKLQISGATPNLTTGYSQLNVFSTDALSANSGGRISLGGVSGTGGLFDPYGFVAIAGLKENATASNFAGYFTVSTSTSGGTVTERMRIDSSGNVGIGNTANNDTRRLFFNTLSGGTTAIESVTVGATNQALVFKTTFSTESEKMRIDGQGNVGIGTSSPAVKLDVAGPIKTLGYTVATLPAGVVGMRAYVTDALAPAFGVTVAGSGAVTIPVFYNGANWIVA
jgi:hypothetical protein